MFDNIGGKIKATTKVCCWLLIIMCVICGVIMMKQNFFVGLLIAGVGSLFSWIGCFALYALGEIAENSSIQTNILAKWDMEMDKKADK